MSLTLGLLAGGALIKGATDIYGAHQDRKAGRASAAALRTGVTDAARMEQESLQRVIDMYGPESEMGQNALQALYSGTMDGSFIPERDDFSYDRSIKDFLDPSIAYQQSQAANQLKESAAASGGMLSGPALAALQKQSMQIGQTGWDNAYSKMTNDKASAYQMYADEFAARRQAAQDRISQLSNISSMGQNAKSNIAQATQGIGTSQANLSRGMGQINAGAAQLNPAFNKAVVGSMGNMVSQGANAYAGYLENPPLGDVGQTPMTPTDPTAPTAPNAIQNTVYGKPSPFTAQQRATNLGMLNLGLPTGNTGGR